MRRILLLPLLLCPLVTVAAGASPAASWRTGWGLVPTADATAQGTVAGPVASLTLEGGAPQWQARVENHLAGPVQVALRPGAGAPALPGLPLQTVLPSSANRVVARLQLPPDAQRLDLLLDAVPGDPSARPQDVAYRLPFDARRFQVTQAPQGRFSHGDAENRDAVDFALPEGTPVLAARAGKVMQVQGNFSGNGQDPLRDRERANFIRILHEDGSMAVYAHLRENGVLVRSGQRVEAGQRIGVSGNTGFSTAPHLHFVVQANVGMQLRSIPARIVAPQGELHFAREQGDAGQAATP
ncbi:M23 family metallopeptidase [Stenotrophomonas aracearum]|jgi:murein DD-endopeptidase MepM/ murein hydrolase activator NlpD|uniref:M23 family metallopeptidase n=1 Tax=Stenotrophomonas aracearum TaxID=3003272 RepID=A0ABY9YBP6_9GAMM|nr:M23 family metallopeptidase [Stenotrophomonas sp. A5588]WNH47840.1 M23 family metallopeptidase [Stenotrophomonas sp. A5588]